MAQRMNRLSARAAAALDKPGLHSDGGGLYLQVKGAARSWVFRYAWQGRERYLGLGSLAAVSLADARQAAAAARKLLADGKDPIAARDAAARDAAAAVAAEATRRDAAPTFRQVAERYIAAHEKGWRNDKHRAQWRATLAAYAYPVFGDKPVKDIGTDDVMAVLQPIWNDKTETASRLRGRIESVLDYAKALELRTAENPARWRGHVKNLLPARSKVQRVEHHAALPWRETGAFVVALAGQDGMATLALRFVILTAARSGEVLGATWREFDLAEGVWTVPGRRMKAGKDHRVPLSPAALDLLRQVGPLRPADDQDGTAFVFPGLKAGRPLSGMAMGMALRRLGRGDLTVHGFRSTFRDWVAETTAYPGELAEAALAHALSDKVEAAYRRGDMFDKRRKLMADWATFCNQPQPLAGAVVPIRGRKGA